MDQRWPRCSSTAPTRPTARQLPRVKPTMVSRSGIGRALVELVVPGHPVAGTTHGEHEERGGRVSLDLLAETPYVNRHGGDVAEVPAPDPTQQLILGEGVPAVQRQKGDQLELARGQGQRLLALPYLACLEVDHQGTHPDVLGQVGH